MARGIVVVGTPGQLLEGGYTNKNGEEVTTLQFVLEHPATSMSGTLQFEANRPEIIEKVRTAHELGLEVHVAAIPNTVAYKDKQDGSDKVFVKLRPVAVLTPVPVPA